MFSGWGKVRLCLLGPGQDRGVGWVERWLIEKEGGAGLNAEVTGRGVRITLKKSREGQQGDRANRLDGCKKGGVQSERQKRSTEGEFLKK